MRPLFSGRFLAYLLSALFLDVLVLPTTYAATRLVSYDAIEYAFRGPDHIPPGLTTIQIVNKGKEPHHIQILKLDSGKTVADFRAAMKSKPDRFPAWAHSIGGPNTVVPGDRAATSQYLAPGMYLLVCVIPDRAGRPHFARGMIKPVIVSSGDAPSVPTISPDVVITLSDFHFTLSAPIKAGTRTIQVINRGTQVHEVVVVRLPPDGSIKRFAEAFAPGAPLPESPPGTPIGGVTGIEPGWQEWLTMTFDPGRYGLVCFSLDPETGVPHFAKGMLTEFDVTATPSLGTPKP